MKRTRPGDIRTAFESRYLFHFSAFFAAIFLLLATGCVERQVRESDDVATPKAAPVATSQPATETSAKPAAPVEVSDTGGSKASAEYHFSMAQAYSSEGNSDQAIEEYKATLMYDPNSALVYARLATEYVKKGMLSAAMETCKEALQRDPNFIDARLILAGLYSTAREPGQALAQYDRILKANPKDDEAIVYKSEVLTEMGRGEDAVRVLRQFVKKNPDSVLAFYYLGQAEEHDDHFKEAVLAYRKALELKPGFTQAALALAYLYEEKQMNPKAISVYRDLYEDSQDLTAATRLSTIYLKEERYAQALPYLEAIQAADPDDLNAQVKLGLVQMEMKSYDNAISTFKRILQKSPDSDRIHYYLASAYEESDKIPESISELKQIKTSSKFYADSALHVAYLLKQGNQVAEAKEFIRDAIRKAPHNPSFYVFEASMEEEAKNYRGAIAILDSAAKDFPDDEKIRYYLGSLYDRQGNIDKGLEQMEAILKINPENVDALNYIGYTWTQKGIRLNEAEKLLRRAMGLRPDNGYIQDSWGWYLFVRGRVKEAVVQLEKAARLKPNEATILEHLGDAYVRSNLREKAFREYKDAAKYADEDTRREIEQKLNNLRHELVQNADEATRMPASRPSESAH